MKVALVTPRYAPRAGGLERHVGQLAQAVVRQGGEVEVLTPETDPSLPLRSEHDGIVVRRFQSARAGVPFALSALWDHLRRAGRSYDVVHAHVDRGLLPLVAAQTRPQRMLLTLHAPVERLLQGPEGRTARAAIVRSAGIVCASQSEAEWLTGALPGVSGNVVVVPDGIDIAAIHRAEPIITAANVVLVVGRLERFKRVDRVIAALAGLERSFELVIAGDGPARRSLERFARELDISRRVRFLGAVPDPELYAWLHSARVVVNLSLQSAFGFTVLEALAAGTPVVASDIAVHREAASYAGQMGVTLVAPETSPLALGDAIVHASSLGLPAPPLTQIPEQRRMADVTVGLYEAIIAGQPFADALTSVRASQAAHPAANGLVRFDGVGAA